MSIPEQLDQVISAPVFAAIWPEESPPFAAFMSFLVPLLTQQLPADASDFQVRLKRTDRWRVRVDGTCGPASHPLSFYAEIVWLPSGKTYRGTAHVRSVSPAPQPKTIEEFVAAVEAISEASNTIVSAQAQQARIGFHPAPGELPRAFPAIFALFGRFPDEDSDDLVALAFQAGGYEDALARSLRSAPSTAALNLTSGLLTKLGPAAQVPWLELIRSLASEPSIHEEVREQANALLQSHDPV